MPTQAAILAGIGVYIVIMIVIGFYASRESHSLADFTVAGRKMPLWLCSISVFATWFGGGTMMGAATAAYEGDTLLMIGEPFGSGVCLLLSGLFFARIYRRTRRLTWPEFFEARYGRFAGAFASVADIISHVIWLGGVLFVFGVLLESLAGVPMLYGVFGGLFVVVFYTMIGGMWAVALTDFIQTTIFIIGISILLVVVLDDAGGWGRISAQLPEHSFRLMPLNHTFDNWADHIHVWMNLGVAAIASTSIIQRALSAKSETTAQNSFLLAGTAYITIGLVPLMLGFSARIVMPDVGDPNAVLTHLAVEYLHPVFVAIFLGAIVSAIMSTSDSILLGVGTLVSTNLLPLVRREPSERLRLGVARWTIPVCGLLATYVAFNATRVVEVLIDATAVLLSMVIAPFILCFWWNKANKAGALAGMSSGLVAWQTAEPLGASLHPDLIGFAVSLVVMIVVSLLTQKVSPPKPLTDIDGGEVALTNRTGLT